MHMDSFHTGAPQKRRGTYLNAILTANAVLLGLVLVGNAPRGTALPTESSALAQPPEDGDATARISAADQRKQIIAELQGISAKMAALDARLKGPLTVKVMDAPKDAKENANQPARAPK